MRVLLRSIDLNACILLNFYLKTMPISLFDFIFAIYNSFLLLHLQLNLTDYIKWTQLLEKEVDITFAKFEKH